jgi:microcystin-dependent protein
LFRVPGGELTHELTVAELPAHDHAIFIFPHSEYQRANQGYQGLENVGRPAPQGPGGQAQRYTELAGGNKPVNMMPPYIALYFCRKD